MSSIAAGSVSMPSLSAGDDVGPISGCDGLCQPGTPETLCNLCRRIDFEYVGFHYSSQYAGNSYFIHRDFLAVLESSRNCTFCKRVVRIATEWKPTVAPLRTDDLDIRRSTVQISLETDWHILQTAGHEERTDSKAHSDRIRLTFSVPSLKSDKVTWQTRHLTFFLQRYEQPSTFAQDSLATLSRGSLGNTVTTPYGGRMRPLTVDMTLFKAWKQLCQQLHGPKCTQIFKSTAKIRPRVIDVHRRCLTWAKEDDSWVCLTYVWGKTESLRLTNNNSEALSVPGSLTADVLPNIVEDALQVTVGLGEQYLWVDSLCIKQDDKIDKAEFISRMDSIYILATVVIVAATCIDSNSHLPGLKSSSPRQGQEPFTVRNVTLVQSLDPAFDVKVDLRTGRAADYLGDTIWGTRAWTLQERFLASRSLVFTLEQVFWECEEAFWCEDSFRELPDISPDPHRSSLCAGELNLTWNSDVPTLDHYYRALLEEYSTRALTFDSDGLNAFSGIIRAFENSMSMQFFWGMPTAFLESALAWGHHTHKLRRRGCIRAPDGKGENQFPTWSWTGWTGDGLTRLNNQALTTEALGLRYYKVSENGQDMVELKQASKFNPRVDLLAEGSKILGWSSRPYQVFRRDLSTTSSLPLSSVLCFFTTYTRLDITRRPSGDRSIGDNDDPGWDISMSQDGHAIQVSWSHIPSFGKDETVEVIAVAQNRGVWDNGHIENGAIGVMIISWDGSIAYRRGFAWIAIRDWVALRHREWRLIILG